eukprot:TRINITY_DN5263_c0_g1_i1.p1 TRINITY_DN5263_c0_g1~~TRINITY_DN5263_c0_g1_i1.p1  ORF type:complete len:116 (+),score=2.73 TRINITY_DN5263_c0_g1_i1:78-425(+)
MAEADFNEGLCECFNDCEICLCSFCFPCVQVGRNMGEDTGIGEGDCCTWSFLYILANVVGAACIVHLIERGRVREHFGIKGDVIGDLMCVLCCAPCALAQEGREIKSRRGLYSQM